MRQQLNKATLLITFWKNITIYIHKLPLKDTDSINFCFWMSEILLITRKLNTTANTKKKNHCSTGADIKIVKLQTHANKKTKPHKTEQN